MNDSELNTLNSRQYSVNLNKQIIKEEYNMAYATLAGGCFGAWLNPSPHILE